MPPPPPLEPPVPKTEMEELQMRTNQVTDESLSSTRRMLALCEESKEAGIRTLVALDDQGEQLDNIEKGMIQVNEDMKQAEVALKGMEACCFGICTNPFNKSSEFKEDAGLWKGKEDGNKGGGNNQPPPGAAFDMTGVPTYGGYIGKYADDAREDEMEKNMEQVSTMVGNLRNMAIDMGSEVENQNKQLDRLVAMGGSNEARISVAVERAGKLLNA